MKLQPTAERMAAGVERHYFRKSSGSRHTHCLKRVTSSLIVTGALKRVTCRMCQLMVRLKKGSQALALDDPKSKGFDETKHRHIIRLTDAKPAYSASAIVITRPLRRVFFLT